MRVVLCRAEADTETEEERGELLERVLPALNARLAREGRWLRLELEDAAWGARRMQPSAPPGGQMIPVI